VAFIFLMQANTKILSLPVRGAGKPRSGLLSSKSGGMKKQKGITSQPPFVADLVVKIKGTHIKTEWTTPNGASIFDDL
jgi:hypothetical protein